MSSVIFQGAVSIETHASIRRSIVRLKCIAPSVRVIISTWRSSAIPELGQDLTIYSDDLSSYTPDGYKACNLHRQIVSTVAGVDAVSDEICAKLRTDIEIVDEKLFFAYLSERRGPATIFDYRITAIDYSSVDPLRNDMPLPYHVCDWVYIGCKEDVFRMFSAPLPNPEFYRKYAGKRPTNQRLAGYAEAMRAETYLTAHAIGRTHWLLGYTCPKISRYAAIRSNIRIAENFDIRKLSELGLASTRHNVSTFNPNRYTSWSEYLWRDIPKSGLRRRWRKFLISLYYMQRPILGQLRTLAGSVKFMVRRAVNN